MAHRPLTEDQLWGNAIDLSASLVHLSQLKDRATPEEIIRMARMSRELACVTQELENRAVGMRLPKFGD